MEGWDKDGVCYVEDWVCGGCGGEGGEGGGIGWV